MSFNPLNSHMTYDRIAAAAITKSDTVDNLVGVRYLYITGAGNIVFRHYNGDLSAAVPVTVGQNISIGRSVAAVHSTNTTATAIAFH